MHRLSKIANKNFGKRRLLSLYLKSEVLFAKNYKCQCLGLVDLRVPSQLELHHKIPVSRAGPDSLENILVVCHSCHTKLHSEKAMRNVCRVGVYS